MQTKQGNIHLEIQTSRKSPVGIIRNTFWDKTKKSPRHTQLGRITGCTVDQLMMLQLAFREKVVPVGSPKATSVLSSRELGASRAAIAMAKKLGLHRILLSRSEPWVDAVLAMIAGRIVYQGSKLSLCNIWRDSCLWELCGIDGEPKVESHCYQPLDRLLQRQKAIQIKLAAKHASAGTLVLYDITSTYFEGEYKDSELVKYGYNRDGKKGHEQVVVGLITNAQGCPIGSEVFAGNTKDCTTVMGKIEEIRNEYGLDHFVFVGDRGMITQQRFEDIRALGNISTIGALTHGQLKELIQRDLIQPELFDETNIVEIIDPDSADLRYCLCLNPITKITESKTRQRLLELTEENLKLIADYKKSVTVEKLGARVGRILQKYKMGKFIIWSIEAGPESPSSRKHRLAWSLDQDKIKREEELDGCYVIRTDVEDSRMNTLAVVESYKALGNVERAFRNIKTVQLEMRPVYHKTDERIRAHVFLCTLAYYVQWHMMQKLKPLFEADGSGAEHRWTFAGVINRLKQICEHEINMGGVTYRQATLPDEEQQEILRLLET
ncbi:MAG: IS1634 family transposase [Desulfuromonadaceae bacterium]|nr:IS1634 family transposase [Desulfuromonadaceae bacterium]